MSRLVTAIVCRKALKRGPFEKLNIPPSKEATRTGKKWAGEVLLFSIFLWTLSELSIVVD